MEQWLHNGFVLADNLVFIAIGNLIYLNGTIDCLGGIRLQVEKEIAILEESGSEALVQTASYSYHAYLPSVGNILRYDSPHATHNQEHHVHRYDVLHGDKKGELTFLLSEDERPTLGEVIKEEEQWYYDNYDALMTL